MPRPGQHSVVLALSCLPFLAAAQGTCEASSDGSNPKCVGVGSILGVMTVGGQVTEEQTDEFLKAYANWAGEGQKHVHFDSAHVYVGGNSSSLLGKWLLQQPEKMLVATKVNPWEMPSGGPWVDGGLSPARMELQLSDELQRLQTSSVDLLYMHAPDPTTPLRESIQQMASFIQQGKVKTWGLSNFAAWQVAQAAEICKQEGWPLPTAYQGMYNALTRRVELELFPCLQHYGIAFNSYNILAGGLLTGKHKSVESIPTDGRFANNTMYQKRFWKETYFQALEMVSQALAPFGIPMAEAAMRWAVHHSAIVAQFSATQPNRIILGASGLKHLQSNMKAMDAGPLPPEVVLAFDRGWDHSKALAPCYFWPGSQDCETRSTTA
eukprot:gnl/MRDRNA2_/MRDRNA2_29772_c0_seq1.p1 gnl/MRDRNA2_/MRDRNA2_29772_c0~~gnl/MRDRNA2_/MRDRNA2_29772_c0_seq1.p1  ORF type:complete len:380 (+),score=64.27 gnl/MRDRNA2_/MRDRNA2_29772_c0_seq1:95-1234(+)